MANFILAKRENLFIIPVINKIDMIGSEKEEVA